MNVVELIRQCEQRRDEILSKLPPELKKEFGELETTIRRTRAILEYAKATKSTSRNGAAGHAPIVNPEPVTEQPTVAPEASRQEDDGRQRISLDVRKKELIEFLRAHGPMRRNKIQVETAIPNGSLSTLLQAPEFVKDERNQWRVKES